jgi:hypothetical protein
MTDYIDRVAGLKLDKHERLGAKLAGAVFGAGPHAEGAR